MLFFRKGGKWGQTNDVASIVQLLFMLPLVWAVSMVSRPAFVTLPILVVGGVGVALGGAGRLDLLLDAWLIVGIQLAAIGIVALWGARQPWKYIALVPVIVLTEAVGAAWDIYSLLCSGEAEWVVFTTLAAHAVIVLGAWYTWTAAHREKAQQGAVTS